MTDTPKTDSSSTPLNPDALRPARVIHRRTDDGSSIILRLWNRLLPRLLGTRIAWVLLGSILLLCTISLAAVRVSSPALARVQEIHIGIGLVVLLAAIAPAYRQMGRFAYVFFGFTLVLLVIVLKAPAVNGSHRWFILPGGINFQPSELAKIAFVVAVAWYLRLHKDIQGLSRLVVPFLLMLLPMGLILIESDLGTALLFPLALYAMLVAAGARLRHLVAIALIALSVAPGCYPLLKPYQKQRIISMFVESKPTSGELHGNLYQQRQSEIAEGSGGIAGQGLRGAAQIRNGLLPESANDFIFAVNSARAFNQKLELDGIILTKFDSDTRGGAALSVKAITGKPIKFLGVGEKLQMLEEFHPDRIAQRILGMGDILTLVEKAQSQFDQTQTEKMQEKLANATFTLDDFLEQMRSMRKMGPMKQLLGMLPGLGSALKDIQLPEEELDRAEAIIQSMSRKERENPDIVDSSRRRRIARGCGLQTEDVSRLVKGFSAARDMAKKMSGLSMGSKMKMAQAMSTMNPESLSTLGHLGGTGPALRPSRLSPEQKRKMRDRRRRGR